MAERVLNKRTFRCDPLMAKAALSLVGRVADVAGPMVGILAAIAEPDDSVRGAMFADAAKGALSSLNNPAFQSLIIDLAQMCTVDREPVIVDGNVQSLDEVIEIALWAMEVQIGPFLRGGALKRIGDRLGAVLTGTA